MKQILILGAGKIGTLIASLLQKSDRYQVTLIDKSFASAERKRLLTTHPEMNTAEIDVSNQSSLINFIKQHEFTAMVSCLPFFINLPVAEAAKQCGLHYFDLTEDNKVTAGIKKLAKDANIAFVPQCGIAPGFVGIVANSLVKDFDKLDSVKLRVGALPQHVNNALHYALTWSTEGLINEYLNPCPVIRYGKNMVMQPLQGLEEVQLDGIRYEAFHTSGGLGSLVEICEGKTEFLNYKTLRYPGHCRVMNLLIRDLKLYDDRDTLQRILENAIPRTYQDVVIVYVSVSGYKYNTFLEESFVKKIYPQMINGLHWSAIQVVTASGLCVVLDLLLQHEDQYRGFVKQECFTLKDVLANQFGTYFK